MWSRPSLASSKSNANQPRNHPLRTRAAGLVFETLEERCLLSAGITPNDAHFHQQWGLELTEAPKAWEITTGSTQVTVAVNDTGVDYTHPDLYKNIWINQKEIPKAVAKQLQDVDADGLITFWDLNDPSGVNIGPGKITDLNGTGFIDGGDLIRPAADGGWADGKDNGNNGFVDDLIGWDFAGDDNDPMDTDLDVATAVGHGTFIAGIIGAVGNNGIGVAGINWKIQIMPVVRSGPGATAQATIDAIYYAVDNGARVSNHSYGALAQDLPPSFIDDVHDAIAFAAKRDHLVVAGAGNDGLDSDDTPRLPAALDLPNIIALAGTDRNDDLASFSGFGATSVDLGAPARWIWSTIPVSMPGDDYFATYGVSFANPHVVGTTALILARNPDLSFAEVKSLILDNVDPLPDLQGKTLTGGRLNIFKAVSATPPAGAAGVAAQSSQDASDVEFANLVLPSVVDELAFEESAVERIAEDQPTPLHVALEPAGEVMLVPLATSAQQPPSASNVDLLYSALDDELQLSAAEWLELTLEANWAST